MRRVSNICGKYKEAQSKLDDEKLYGNSYRLEVTGTILNMAPNLQRVESFLACADVYTVDGSVLRPYPVSCIDYLLNPGCGERLNGLSLKRMLCAELIFKEGYLGGTLNPHIFSEYGVRDFFRGCVQNSVISLYDFEGLVEELRSLIPDQVWCSIMNKMVDSSMRLCENRRAEIRLFCNCVFKFDLYILSEYLFEIIFTENTSLSELSRLLSAVTHISTEKYIETIFNIEDRNIFGHNSNAFKAVKIICKFRTADEKIEDNTIGAYKCF